MGKMRIAYSMRTPFFGIFAAFAYFCSRFITTKTKMRMKNPILLSVKHCLKWLTLILTTLLTAFILYRVNLGIRSALWIFRRDHMPLTLAYLYIMLSGIFGYFTVVWGVGRAPSHKRIAAKVCAATYFAGCCGYVYWIATTETSSANIFREILAALAAMVGAASACLSFTVGRVHHREIYEEVRQADKMLTAEQWQLLKDTIDEDYPKFFAKLASLKAMNEMERNVCLLVKAEVPPTQMATILCTSKQNVASIRSRLCQKNFGKGGAADWDEYIASL